MNRPFYAFGVLLALLALAMLAVSSTTRSKRVQNRPAQAEGSLLSPSSLGGAIYVIVLPAGDEAPASGPLAAESPAPVVVAPATFDASRIRHISPVCVIEAAYDAAESRAAENADCHSHYDLEYDRLIYGAARVQTPLANRPIDWQRDDVGTELTIFESLAALRRTNQAVKPRGSFTVSPFVSGKRWRRLAADVRAWMADQHQLALLQRWIAQTAERLAWTSQAAHGAAAIDWADYAELMQMIVPPAEQPQPAVKPATSSHVQSGGWLLHFAVSSLSRAGVVLQQAAARLEELDGEPVAPQPGPNAE